MATARLLPDAQPDDRSGHVFKRPFKSEPIKDELQLVAAINYVAANPVSAGLCATDGDWRWSSHGDEADIHRGAVMRVQPVR